MFLSGLVNGLGRAVSAAIANMEAETFLLSSDSEEMLTLSNVTKERYVQYQEEYSNDMEGFTIFCSTVTENGNEEKEDIIYYGINSNGFLNPETIEGDDLSVGEHYGQRECNREYPWVFSRADDYRYDFVGTCSRR